MKTREEISDLIVKRYLRLWNNAIIKVRNADGTETDIDLTEILALNDISAAELAFLDGVTAGTVTASKAVVVDANKDVGDLRNLDCVNIDAGASGTAGTVDVFPTTASKGKLIISCTDQDADTNVTLKPAAMGQASVISIPDPGAATANVLLTDKANDGAVVTSTAAELNILDGATATTAEVNYLDLTTGPGTQEASKSVVADANVNTGISKVTELHIGVSGSETQVDATAAELNAAADVSARLVDIGDNTTYTSLVANSGKPHVIPDLTGSLTITLPTPAAGLEYEFTYYGVAADAQNWIIDSGSDTNYFVGGLAHLDTDAGLGGDEIVPIAGNGSSNSKLTVVTPDVGTRVKLVCTGTLWILSGYAVSATVPSFANQ